MKNSREEYYNQIKENIIFKPIIKEINLNKKLQLDNFNNYQFNFKHKNRKYRFIIEYSKKGKRFHISFHSGKITARPILKDEDVTIFIYSKLINLFSQNNKSYIDWNDIEEFE